MGESPVALMVSRTAGSASLMRMRCFGFAQAASRA